jgi:hypothetical protein
MNTKANYERYTIYIVYCFVVCVKDFYNPRFCRVMKARGSEEPSGRKPPYSSHGARTTMKRIVSLYPLPLGAERAERSGVPGALVA